MQRLLSPNSSSLQSYSNATVECLERSDVAEDSSTLISGSTFGDGNLAWLARGSALEVVNRETGERTAAWRFGWGCKVKRPVTITAVVSFQAGRKHYLVVGLKDFSGCLPGMVCLFDPSVSRVCKAINIPYPVTSLECVASDGGADVSPSLLSIQLKLCFGVVAVGTEQGHTYLIDMRLDDDTEIFDEWYPSILEIMDCQISDISVYRESAREKDVHVAMEMGAEAHQSGQFYFDIEDSKNQKVFSSGDVFVSAIKYIPQTGCLVIGYNFGCFFIWDLNTMAIVYTSQADQYEMSAITHLTYLEPENDPRSCSYLWVARGPLTAEDESLEIPTTLTLYQLIFSSREMLPGYGIVYKDLSGCGRRFEHQLTADAHHLADATSVGSRVICCYTLEKEAIDISKGDEGPARDLTLMVCVWEAPSHDPLSGLTCHLGIFDINRWYHSQMQPSIRDAMFGSKDSTCPFFAFFSLAEILDIASPDGIIDLHIDSTSVSRFANSIEPPLEQHYWPASLKFDVCCLMETGLVHSKFLGMQRQILASLHCNGVSSLTDAHSYFNMCWSAGLLPRNLDMSNSHDKNFHLEAILSICLEHGLISFITSCINNLGSQIGSSGFSLRLILDWSWTRVVSIKEQLDQLSVPLFDGGGGTPDHQMLLLLDDMAVQLRHLKSIFQSLLDQSESTSQQGCKDLTEKLNVLSILSKYLKLLLWLIRHSILPEKSIDEYVSSFGQREIVCSPASFKEYYNKRRSEMHTLGGNSIAIGLMIDKVVSQFNGLWVSPAGKEQYPPSSLHALCGLYLLDKVTPDFKNSIILYYLLDVCSVNSDINNQDISDQFAQAFDMPDYLSKLIKAFWYMDHKNFEEAMKLLIDESLRTREMGVWQNNYIIKTLLLQGEFQKALDFVKTVCPTMHTFEDVKLHLTVLLTNGLVTEAFNFQRQHRNPSINSDLLISFFSLCQQNGNIGKVMELPLNIVEEEHFVDFLQHASFDASKEMLVMYYLQRGRYVEGVRLNEAIKKDIMNEQNPKVLERSKVRNAIVDGYIRCLPSIQRKLIFLPEANRPQVTMTQAPPPKPLSTVLHHSKQGRPVSHASLLNSVMEKVAEARPQTTPQKRRSGPFVGTPLTPGTKGLLSDSHRMVFAHVKKPEVLPEEDVRPSKTKVVTPPSLLDKKRRKQLYSGADALALLTTPRIVKRPSRQSIANESITVSTTPQSILKVSRVVRRSTSPSTSPPLSRRGLNDNTKLDKGKKKDSVDSTPAPSATPSRRIRFASEDLSPAREKTPNLETMESDATTADVVMDTIVPSPPATSKGVSFMDHDEGPSKTSPQVYKDKENVEIGQTEVQITAAVVDLRGTSHLVEDVVGQEEEDYSSYELDESDNIIADSEEEVISRRNLLSSPNISSLEKSIHLENEPPLMRSSPRTPASLSSEDQVTLQSRTSPRKSPSPKKKTPPTDLTMTPPKSPPIASFLANSTKALKTEGVEDYAFSPPAVLRTPQPPDQSTSSTTTDSFFFSPPLTRSMMKRRSLENSKSGDISITGRSLRPRSQQGRCTPNQSPTDSPLSFITPASTQPKSPKGSRSRSAKKPLPKHKMTLRSRLTLRSATKPAQ